MPLKNLFFPLPISLSKALRVIKHFKSFKISNSNDEEVEDHLQRSLSQLLVVQSLFQYLAHYSSNLVPHKRHLGISDGPSLSLSFKNAYKDPDWAAAIDREYNALAKRETRTYVLKHEVNTSPVNNKWTFSAKQIDNDGKEFIFEAIYTLSEDKQTSETDFNPDTLYAPVASHESN